MRFLRSQLIFLCFAFAGHARASADDKPTWWAFKSPQKTASPVIGGVTTIIDSFLLAKLHAKGLTYAPKAKLATLIRRLSFDLTGLPPSVELLKMTYEQAIDCWLRRNMASGGVGTGWTLFAMANLMAANTITNAPMPGLTEIT